MSETNPSEIDTSDLRATLANVAESIGRLAQSNEQLARSVTWSNARKVVAAVAGGLGLLVVAVLAYVTIQVRVAQVQNQTTLKAQRQEINLILSSPRTFVEDLICAQYDLEPASQKPSALNQMKALDRRYHLNLVDRCQKGGL